MESKMEIKNVEDTFTIETVILAKDGRLITTLLHERSQVYYHSCCSKSASQYQKHHEFIFILEYFINQKLSDTNEEDWEKLDWEERDPAEVAEVADWRLCICNQDICDLCPILHKPTNKSFIVGNECIKKNIPKLYEKLQYQKQERREQKKLVKEAEKQEIRERHAKLKEEKRRMLEEERARLAKLKEEKRKMEEVSKIDEKAEEFMTFGMHKNKTFEEIVTKYSSYARWLVREEVFKKPNSRRNEYVHKYLVKKLAEDLAGFDDDC
jgi:dGTP triphosphohydrolase